jgi:ribonuclease BN (tRNA processing enzyme)
MPKACFLGTNGWYDSKTGDTVCTLLEYGEFNVILDAGGGFSKLDRYIDFAKPAYLFLSHLHLDHIFGLHTLPKYVFPAGLHILVPKNSVGALRTFMDFPYTAPIRMIEKYMAYRIKITGLPSKPALPFKLAVLPMVHSVETLAARIEAEGRVVSYVVDTGYCDNALKIAKDADLLISECSHRSGESNSAWPHLAPEEAAELAAKSSCKRLVMTHFDANRYPSFASRASAVRIARKIFRNTTAARDGMVVEF